MTRKPWGEVLTGDVIRGLDGLAYLAWRRGANTPGGSYGGTQFALTRPGRAPIFGRPDPGAEVEVLIPGSFSLAVEILRTAFDLSIMEEQ